MDLIEATGARIRIQQRRAGRGLRIAFGIAGACLVLAVALQLGRSRLDGAIVEPAQILAIMGLVSAVSLGAGLRIAARRLAKRAGDVRSVTEALDRGRSAGGSR